MDLPDGIAFVEPPSFGSRAGAAVGRFDLAVGVDLPNVGDKLRESYMPTLVSFIALLGRLADPPPNSVDLLRRAIGQGARDIPTAIT